MEAGIIQEVRDRQEYTKPSEKRAKAKAAGRARWMKKQRQMEMDGKLPPSQIKRRKQSWQCIRNYGSRKLFGLL